MRALRAALTQLGWILENTGLAHDLRFRVNFCCPHIPAALVFTKMLDDLYGVLLLLIRLMYCSQDKAGH